MNCTRARELLGSYLDKELDAHSMQSVEAHLQTCSACQSLHREQRALSMALKRHGDVRVDLDELRARVASHLVIAAAADARPASSSPRRNWALPASLAAAVLMTWGLTYFSMSLRLPGLVGAEDAMVDAAVAGHRRSAIATDLAGIASADAGVLRTWLSARLPFSPPVIDLSPHGYLLTGARLDYLYGAPAAALSYRADERSITVLVWKLAEAMQLPASLLADEGLNIKFWQQQGIGFCAISELDAERLTAFVRAYQR